MLRCGFEHWTFKNTVDCTTLRREMFIPLQEKPSDTVVRVPTLGDGFDDEIENVYAWRTHAMSGKYPVIWVKVTLFEDAGLGKQGGERRTLDGPFEDLGKSKVRWTSYYLKHLAWDGAVGVSIEEEASSILLELVSGSGK